MGREEAGPPVGVRAAGRDAGFTPASGAVLRAAGVGVIGFAVRAPRMNPVTERWSGGCGRELPGRTLSWNRRHLMIVPRGYEDSCATHRPRRTLGQAAPLRPLPDSMADPDQFPVQRRDRAGDVIHRYRLVA